MHIEELDQYKVACHISRRDMKENGIIMDDIVNRTPLGHMFFQRVSELAKSHSPYEWPNCAHSMQIEFYPDEVVLILSERIEDYVYNLKQTVQVLPEDQKEDFEKLIQMIQMSEEEEARGIIRNFEKNIKNVQ